MLAVGAALGGTVGLGTVLYALSIGPLVHVLLPRMTVPQPAPHRDECRLMPPRDRGDIRRRRAR